MPKTTTPTRADEVRRYVELDALGLTLGNIAVEILDSSDYTVSDYDGSSGELLDRLFPSDSEYEGTLEWKLAQAESCALTARIFVFLASDEGRAFCSRHAMEQAKIAEGFAQSAREAMSD
jgi:hypothetical protein